MRSGRRGNHFQAQSSLDALVEASGELKTVAISLHKIANDIRFIASGPRAGLGEITLPEVQPGSSIMPGKINPVIAESVVQVVAQGSGERRGCYAGGAGRLLRAEHHDAGGGAQHTGIDFVVGGLGQQFRRSVCRGHRGHMVGPNMVEKGLMLGTALAPAIGYDAAASIAKEAAVTGSTIREMAKEKTDLSDEELGHSAEP